MINVSESREPLEFWTREQVSLGAGILHAGHYPCKCLYCAKRGFKSDGLQMKFELIS